MLLLDATTSRVSAAYQRSVVVMGNGEVEMEIVNTAVFRNILNFSLRILCIHLYIEFLNFQS